MVHRGKNFSLCILVTAVLAVGLATFQARHRIMEEYYIYQLNNGYSQAKEDASAALGKLGTDRAALALIRALDAEPSRYDRVDLIHAHSKDYRAKALTRIGWRAVPRLIEALGSNSVDTRCVAAHVLGDIGAQAATAVPSLIRTMSPEMGISYSAINALGCMGTVAGDAAPYLTELLKDESWRTGGFEDRLYDVHLAARNALRLIAMPKMGNSESSCSDSP